MPPRHQSAETTPGFRASPESVAIQWRLVADAIAGRRGGRRMKAITRCAAVESRAVTCVPLVASASQARSGTASPAVLAQRGSVGADVVGPRSRWSSSCVLGFPEPPLSLAECVDAATVPAK